MEKIFESNKSGIDDFERQKQTNKHKNKQTNTHTDIHTKEREKIM